MWWRTSSSSHGCTVSFPSVWVLIQPGRSDRLSPRSIHELAHGGAGIFWAQGLLNLCSPCACEGGLRYEGDIAGFLRTGEPTSRDKLTPVRAEGGGTPYDHVGQTRLCHWRGYKYF